MTKVFRNALVALSLILICAPELFAQQNAEQPLPRVLIIGDSIYSQHARGAVTELKDQATVQFANWPKGMLPSSTNAIKHLEQLLGEKDQWGNDVPEGKRPTWDVIHFNLGLGDLIYSVPDINSHRVLPFTAGGVIRTSTKQYEKNLDEFVRLLKQKAPRAKLVWASTTPIRHSRENVFKPGDEIEYNQVAARVMSKHGLPINDMHAYVIKLIDMDKPAGHGVDPFFFDKKPLHPPVVVAIRNSLGIK